jgi:hypothetical protein
MRLPPQRWMLPLTTTRRTKQMTKMTQMTMKTRMTKKMTQPQLTRRNLWYPQARN